jgi:hypothetical protein
MRDPLGSPLILRAVVGTLILLVACAPPSRTSPAAARPLTPPSPTGSPLPLDDPRQALVGLWQAEFTLDSARVRVRAKYDWETETPPMSVTRRALLHLRDTVTWAGDLVSSIAFDSTDAPFPFFGNTQTRPSHLAPQVYTWLLKEHDTVVRIEPYTTCSDCTRFRVEGTHLGDSIVGTWQLDAMGCVQFGRVRMARVAAAKSQ